MNRTKKQLLERIEVLEEENGYLEGTLSCDRRYFQITSQLKNDVLKAIFEEYGFEFMAVINKRHPGNDVKAKIAKIKEYRDLFGWGLRDSKLFVETGRTPK